MKRCWLTVEQTTSSRPLWRAEMSLRVATLIALLFGAAILPLAQDKAAVQMEKSGSLKAGGPIVFNVKLNQPLPKGAHFDFRISPVSTDEEIPLGSGEPIDATQEHFRIAGKLPEGAVPGQWHISVIWLFLPGSGWTHTQIAPNDLRFQVEGKSYPLPSKAEVTLVPEGTGSSNEKK